MRANMLDPRLRRRAGADFLEDLQDELLLNPQDGPWRGIPTPEGDHLAIATMVAEGHTHSDLVFNVATREFKVVTIVADVEAAVPTTFSLGLTTAWDADAENPDFTDWSNYVASEHDDNSWGYRWVQAGRRTTLRRTVRIPDAANWFRGDIYTVSDPHVGGGNYEATPFRLHDLRVIAGRGGIRHGPVIDLHKLSYALD